MNTLSPKDMAVKETGILNKHVLAALSGGADSVALVLLLNEMRLKGEIRLTCAHFEHGIRKEASLRDRDFCLQLCKKLGVTCLTESACVPDEARKTGEGIETCARRLRHDFLKRAKVHSNADVIALAHHKSDQAETILMHLLRGGGISGARGMKFQEGDLVRPLLKLEKSQLTDYLAAKNQPWREDETNLITDNPRNSLRLNAFPAIERAYPGAADALFRFSQIAAGEDEYMNDAAQAAMREHVTHYAGVSVIKRYQEMHPALLRRVMHALFPGLGFEDIERARKAGARTCLSEGVTAEADGGDLYLFPRLTSPAPAPLLLSGETFLEGVCFIYAEACAPAVSKRDPLKQIVNVDALEGAYVRTRRDGDYIRPLGMDGRKKLLSDVLTDKKIPRPLRDRMPVIARDDEILWAVGAGVSENIKITETTGNAVQLTAAIHTTI